MSLEDRLTRHHERIDALMQRLSAALSGRSEGAAGVFHELAAQLEYHMTWEDEQLFPAVRECVPSFPARSLESLSIDHERIRSTLATLRGAVASGDGPGARSSLDALRVFLEGHNRDEEFGIYPAADRGLCEDRRRKLLESFCPPAGSDV